MTQTTPSSQATPIVDEFHVPVDAHDVRFLKSLQTPEELGKGLRLWWEPMSKRNQTPVAPTHVTIMAETEGEKLYVLGRLETFRNDRKPAPASASKVLSEIPVLPRPGEETVTKKSGWTFGRRDDDGYAAA